MIVKNFYGTTSNGENVDVFTLKNSSGTAVDIITYGATINSIYAADKNGEFADVLIGFDTIEGNETLSNNQGVTVGRYANRICNGTFEIDGVKYDLVKNEKGVTCLHGGNELSRVVWKAIIVDDSCLEMSYTSPDGAKGFPGKVDFKVTFTLFEDNSLKIDYFAVSDKKTVINMTNHSYFNLAGKGDILGHWLTINADKFTPTDEFSIPSGELRNVEGTAFDFREAKPIGRDIGTDDIQLKQCGGYDHNYCINDWDGSLKVAATVFDDESGIVMETLTDLPGVQFYIGNYVGGEKGKNGAVYNQRQGLCLESQYFPNSANDPAFARPLFDENKGFKSTTVYRFSTIAD